MSRFVVRVTTKSYYVGVIEAENRDEAFEKALDGIYDENGMEVEMDEDVFSLENVVMANFEFDNDFRVIKL